MSTKSWKEGDTAHIVIKSSLNPGQIILRQVMLESELYKGVWRVTWHDVDDDANIHSVDTAIQENALHRSAEDALQEAASVFVAALLNENRKWFHEVRPDRGLNRKQ